MQGLRALELQLRRDLRLIAYPEIDWVPLRRGPDGAPVLDVLVVGAGQGGLATLFGLRRERVNRILAIDRAPAGGEGPWLGYARMKTLRSWKTVTGPDLDLACLTYQAWHEAQWGEEDFARLDKIAKENWHGYLQWYRRVLELPVENGTTLTGIEPAESSRFLRARIERKAGAQFLHARKIVLAHGIESSGAWWMPAALGRLAAHLRAHAADEIDFSRLAGRRVAVIGAGASAFDNAAAALEAGAAEVRLYCRRERLQRVQPYKYLSFNGFFRHFRELDDAWRWRFMNYLLTVREALPKETWERCTRNARFFLHEGMPWLDAREEGSGVVGVTPRGEVRADFAIAGTGFEMDLAARPELAGFAQEIATWGDRYSPPQGEENERLARYPYLGPDFELIEKVPGRAPWLRNVRVFTFGATASFGPSGSSINAMKFSAPRIVAGLTRDFFCEDAAAFYDGLKGYATPEF